LIPVGLFFFGQERNKVFKIPTIPISTGFDRKQCCHFQNRWLTAASSGNALAVAVQRKKG